MKKTSDSTQTKPKDKSKVNMKDAHSSSSKPTKPKKPLNSQSIHELFFQFDMKLILYLVQSPFDKVLDKLSKCALTSSESPSIVEVMQENFKELQKDKKYIPLMNAAPHTAAFLKKKKHDTNKFIVGLREALSADWSNPAWKSADEIETLFRPLKQQFVYTMMRFNCT